MGIDNGILHWIAAHRPHWLTVFVRGVEFSGDNHIVQGIVAGGAVLLLVLFRKWVVLVAIVLGSGLSEGVGDILKDVFHRSRPPILYVVTGVPGPAFPSTHAARFAGLSIALYLSFQLRDPVARRILRRVLITGNVLLGAALIYVGAHWFTDVLAGWALGLAIGWATANACLYVKGQLCNSAPDPSHISDAPRVVASSEGPRRRRAGRARPPT